MPDGGITLIDGVSTTDNVKFSPAPRLGQDTEAILAHHSETSPATLSDLLEYFRQVILCRADLYPERARRDPNGPNAADRTAEHIAGIERRSASVCVCLRDFHAVADNVTGRSHLLIQDMLLQPSMASRFAYVCPYPVTSHSAQVTLVPLE